MSQLKSPKVRFGVAGVQVKYLHLVFFSLHAKRLGETNADRPWWRNKR